MFGKEDRYKALAKMAPFSKQDEEPLKGLQVSHGLLIVRTTESLSLPHYLNDRNYVVAWTWSSTQCGHQIGSGYEVEAVLYNCCRKLVSINGGIM